MLNCLDENSTMTESLKRKVKASELCLGIHVWLLLRLRPHPSSWNCKLSVHNYHKVSKRNYIIYKNCKQNQCGCDKSHVVS